MERYAAKAVELGVTVRTIGQWVSDYRTHGEAGLAPMRDNRLATLEPCSKRITPRFHVRSGLSTPA
jgi:Helix-turn-helix domain